MITVVLKPRAGQANERPEQRTYYIAGVFNNRVGSRPHLWQPPTDVAELEDRLVVVVEVAGMEDAGFTISLDHRLLVISGVRQDPINQRKAFHRMEINFGEFQTFVDISVPVDLEAVEASYNNGFLIVSLPKSQPRQIKIGEEQGE